MNASRYRAWRFAVPRLEEEREAVGLRYSLRGGIEMVQDDDSVRQAILLLIATVPGERVMRPEYGCYLNRLVFSPNDDTTAGLAIHYVRRAVERWEPRVDVVRLDAERPPQSPERLEIVLQYRVRATQRADEVRIPLELQGEVVA
jgi:phage baseplate assembly protein W